MRARPGSSRPCPPRPVSKSPRRTQARSSTSTRPAIWRPPAVCEPADPKQDFVGEPTQSCLDSFDLAGFLAENRCPLFGLLSWARARIVPRVWRALAKARMKRAGWARDLEGAALLTPRCRFLTHAGVVGARGAQGGGD